MVCLKGSPIVHHRQAVPIIKVVTAPIDFCSFPLYPRPVTDTHLRAWGNVRAAALRRFWLRGTMGRER
jgi:hypothetical protein